MLTNLIWWGILLFLSYSAAMIFMGDLAAFSANSNTSNTKYEPNTMNKVMGIAVTAIIIMLIYYFDGMIHWLSSVFAVLFTLIGVMMTRTGTHKTSMVLLVACIVMDLSTWPSSLIAAIYIVSKLAMIVVILSFSIAHSARSGGKTRKQILASVLTTIVPIIVAATAVFLALVVLINR